MSLCSLVRRLKQTQHHLDIRATQWASEMLLFNLLHITKTEALVATRDQRKPCVTVRKTAALVGALRQISSKIWRSDSSSSAARCTLFSGC